MHWRTCRPLALALGGLLACGGTEERSPESLNAGDAAARSAVVLRDDSSRTAEGYRVAELDVLMDGVYDAAAARLLLQQVIDSVAAADTLAAAVRVTGFVMGELDPETASADLVRTMQATWGPIDTAGYTGGQRRSRYRTAYVLLHRFPIPDTAERRP